MSPGVAAGSPRQLILAAGSSTCRVFRWALLLGGCMLLTGCPTLFPEPSEPARRYDFGPLPEPVALDVSATLDRINAPSWLREPLIPYRQIYRAPEALNHYSGHRWVAAPTELLGQRLRQLLADDADGAAPWRLELELVSFEQVFTRADEAHAEIRLRAVLRNGTARTGEAPMRHRIHQRQTVSADVQGAISGLPAVADLALQDLLRWIEESTTE